MFHFELPHQEGDCNVCLQAPCVCEAVEKGWEPAPENSPLYFMLEKGMNWGDAQIASCVAIVLGNTEVEADVTRNVTGAKGREDLGVDEQQSPMLWSVLAELENWLNTKDHEEAEFWLEKANADSVEDCFRYETFFDWVEICIELNEERRALGKSKKTLQESEPPGMNIYRRILGLPDDDTMNNN